MTTPRVLVAVPTTCRRQTLHLLIQELGRLTASESSIDAVLIANAPEVPEPIASAATASRVRIKHVPEPGLAIARNAALDEASDYDFLAFIDDDEVPVARWPLDLVAAAERDDADVAMGAIVGHIDGLRPWWLSGPELFRPHIGDPAGVFTGEVYSSNTLIRIASVAPLGVRFDPAFNRSGGEDTDYFRRLRAKGATVTWVPGSEVLESLETDRMRLSWYLGRCMSDSAVLWDLEGRPQAVRGRPLTLLRRVPRALRGVGLVLGGSVTINAERLVRGLADLAIAAGTLLAAFGWRPSTYGPPRS